MVCVLDKRKKPLLPCSLKRARQFLDRGRARVHKRFPFAIRLVDRLQQDSVLQPLTLKIGPGTLRRNSSYTPFAEKRCSTE
jgi:RRXRR protein